MKRFSYILKEFLLTTLCDAVKLPSMKTTAPTIIADNIPLPETKGAGPRSELARLISSMSVGHSFQTSMLRGSIYSLARYYGVRVAIRNEGKMLRVWRVADKPKTNQGDK